MSASKVARRYSKALMGLCAKDKSHEVVSKDLESFVKALNDNPMVASALTNPTVDVAKKALVVREMAKNLGLRVLTINFLLFLNERQRTNEVYGILEDFKVRLDEQSGRLRATVTVATPLSVLDQTRLKAALERTSGKKVTLEMKVDAAILGGVVTKVGNLVLDGSLRAALSEIRTQLTEAVH